MKIHFTGIGGVGMAGLAVLLKERGHEVTGCDIRASARTRWLEEKGIRVFTGHDPAHVADVDEIVLTPAVRPDEPERLAAKGKRVRFRGEVLAELVNSCDSIAVCGTHGKTTTSTWIAKLLIALGENVSWCIGGETGDFPVAGHLGVGVGVGVRCRCRCGCRCTADDNFVPAAQPEENGGYHSTPTPKTYTSRTSVLVVEADESDGTLALYRARTLVVNKLEYDHPDHFKTPEAYFACFDTARRQAGDVVESEELEAECRRRGRRREGCDDAERECRRDGCCDPVFDPILASLAPHNRKNARAAIEVALRRGHAPSAIAAALPPILAQLPDRRYQQIWPHTTTPVTYTSFTVVTDYAHHPTEMACAVAMARAECAGTLRVLFQPHRPSRTKALLADFPAAFAGSDEVVFCPTYMAFEPAIEGGDIADLYKACRESSTALSHGFGRDGVPSPSAVTRFLLARSCEEAWEHARNSMKSGDLTLLLGAGDIIRLVPTIQADLTRLEAERSAESASPTGRAASPRKIWIGAGTNTWKSDLNLSVEYVKTDGPAGRPGAELVAAHPDLCPWMAGIPGTVGGWIRMNAGAFGHSFSEVLEAVKVDGRWIPAADCGFSYRHSDISGEIQDYRLNLQPSTFDLRPETFSARRKKFPAGTYGSFFKNPPGDFAGRLLEAAGAKELAVGGAYVWKDHANVIVRGPGATGSDVLSLARLMYNRVLFRFGVRLEPEVSGPAF